MARQDFWGRESSGKKGGVWGVMRRGREKQDEYAVLKESTAIWQRVDKNMR